MAKEIITLAGDGGVGTEMFDFQGKSCLKVAAKIARELEQLGVVTSIGGLRMKDTIEVEEVSQDTKLKVERG